MQSALRAFSLIYPVQCAGCGEPVEDSHGLCGKCWAETPFVTGHVCDKCGCPLPGESDGETDLCDDCLATRRPWSRGRAALIYAGRGRSFVLGIKYHDRLDYVPPAAAWMHRAARPFLSPDMLVVPVPAHWTRVLTRRYNQASELARALARQAGLDVAPTGLVRKTRTAPQERKTREQRFENLAGTIAPHPKRGALLKDRRVVLVDDVFTSGATLTAATAACHTAGAREVFVLTLARTVKDA
ncbi:MAG: amidophosphoribosyltransferase [Rhodobacterales bacterium]|nr:MAG: amidophosphoribosyltransferase [Rhodobacterales bacterium]